MKTVLKIFYSSANHYKLIGIGLDVDVSDLILGAASAPDNLIKVFQRWFEANRDVNWDTLIKLCDDFPNELSRAKANLEHTCKGKLRSLFQNKKIKCTS